MVAILLGNGFEELEALSPCDVLRRGGVEVRLAGLDEAPVVRSGRGVGVAVDCALSDLRAEELELLVIPGGAAGVQSIWDSEAAVAFIRRAHAAGVPLAAICAGPLILSRLGLLKDRAAVCHPDVAAELDCAAYHPELPVVRAGDITTGRAAAASLAFGFALLEQLRGEETARRVAGGMCYD